MFEQKELRDDETEEQIMNKISGGDGGYDVTVNDLKRAYRDLEIGRAHVYGKMFEQHEGYSCEVSFSVLVTEDQAERLDWTAEEIDGGEIFESYTTHKVTADVDNLTVKITKGDKLGNLLSDANDAPQVMKTLAKYSDDAVQFSNGLNEIYPDKDEETKPPEHALNAVRKLADVPTEFIECNEEERVKYQIINLSYHAEAINPFYG